MSCSVQIKTRNPVKSKKVNNVIHRTTSETIRLGEPDILLNNSSRQVMTAISPPPLKKSTCSFQITGVSVTQRTDIGDDSADDLDESHTDDISRVTDNETPSFSEDTCSRDAEENYLGSCSALCSVTVITTSSQYGLAIVPLDTTIENISDSSNLEATKASETISELTMSGTQNSPTTDVPATTTNRLAGTRFKIVKVETSKPFRRGRWWCMDYLDHSPYTPKNALTYKSPVSPTTCPQLQYTMTATTVQAQLGQVNTESGSKYANPNSATRVQCTETTIVTQSISSMSQPRMYQQPVASSVSQPGKNEQLTFQVHTLACSTSIFQSVVQQNPTLSVQAQVNQMYATNQSNYSPIVHSQPYATLVQQNQTYVVPTQPMQPYVTVHITGSIQTLPNQTVAVQNQTHANFNAPTSVMPHFSLQNVLPHIITSTQFQQHDAMFVNTSQPQVLNEQSSRPVLLHQPISLQYDHNQSSMLPLQGCSMPAQHMWNIQNQNLPPYTFQAPVYVSQPGVQVYPTLIQEQTQSAQNDMQQNQNITQVQINNMEKKPTPPSDLDIPNNKSQKDNLQYLDKSSTASSTSQSSPDAVVPSIASGTQNTPNKEVDCASPDSITAVSKLSTMDSVSISKDTSLDSAPVLDIVSPTDVKKVTTTQVCSVASQTATTPTAMDVVISAAISAANAVSATSAALAIRSVSAASTIVTTSGVPILSTVPPRVKLLDEDSVQKVSQAISVIAASVDVPHADAANNTSAIIDTKIEQAMDLVKSHLMYTVREEVEVLKERIAALLDRINQLETENNFLKANATPEVLVALNNRAPGAEAQGINPSTAGAEGGAPSN